jgi:phosphoglycerate dehydrogenase-like enzyme
VGALTSGKLAGACLDVTDPEPLPSDHALWKLANVVITPHVASDAELTDDRRFALFAENLRRFDAGEPLLNVVDKRAGY